MGLFFFVTDSVAKSRRMVSCLDTSGVTFVDFTLVTEAKVLGLVALMLFLATVVLLREATEGLLLKL
jgi:hypothetical protein